MRADAETTTTRTEDEGEPEDPAEPLARPLAVDRSIVLVGLMGAGKTSIGRRLAQRLGLPFVDADAEIERAAGRTIQEIFDAFGEDEFRQGEKRVIARLLDRPPQVLATGGGAFMAAETRALIKQRAISVWLKADLETLHERVSRRSNRPLLKTADPKETLRRLLEQRYPVYAEADVVAHSSRGPLDETVGRVLEALAAHLGRAGALPPKEQRHA